jgi:hypothetical protein
MIKLGINVSHGIDGVVLGALSCDTCCECDGIDRRWIRSGNYGIPLSLAMILLHGVCLAVWKGKEEGKEEEGRRVIDSGFSKFKNTKV